ncbi:Branched-chain amino acid ABC transporter ATP-binding protein [Azospirillaceae bacterium]
MNCASPSPILSLESITAGYRNSRPCVHDVSLTLSPGEITTLIGVNGAGKTTLLAAIIGLAAIFSGALTFSRPDGRRFTLRAIAIEQRARLGIGYVPEGRRIFPGLTVAETLDVASHARTSAQRAEDAERIYALFPPLREKSKDLAWRLSGGQQQMLALGRALINRPSLILLDEPSQGLSPLITMDLLSAVRDCANTGAAVLIAEQSLHHVRAIADRIIPIANGRLS